MNKKTFENSVLALLGVALIVTSVILLAKNKHALFPVSGDEGDSFPPFDQTDRGLHVFSESGILL